MRTQIRIACMLALLCWSRPAWAEDPPLSDRAPRDVERTLDNSKINLADAIRTAESATGGKAGGARIVEWRRIESNPNMKTRFETASGVYELKPDSPIAKVYCVKGDRMIEALVCCTTGQLIDQHESTRVFDRDVDGRPVAMTTGTSSPGVIYNSRWYQIPGRWQKASDLMGKDVTATGTGEKIGDVKELVIEPDMGRILYVIVEFRSKMGHGNRWYVIPNSSIRLADDYKSMSMAYSSGQFNEANGFDKNHWPEITDEKWAVRVHETFGMRPYWQEAPFSPMSPTNTPQPSISANATGTSGEAAEKKTEVDRDQAAERDRAAREPAPPPTPVREVVTVVTSPRRWQKASDLIGKDVYNAQNEKLGTLKDIALDADSGRVLYGVLSFGGVLGIGDKYFAVPWSSFTLNSDPKQFTLAIDKDRLKNAEGFDKSHWPNLADERWATSTYNYYGQPRYWESGRKD